MQESFNNLQKTQSIDSGKTLEAKYKAGDVIETADGIRTIIVADVNDKLQYLVRVNHIDGGAKEYITTGPAILSAQTNPSVILTWDCIRTIPIGESMN